MIKLFFSIVVIGFILILGWVGFSLLKESLKPEPESMSIKDIDSLIDELEFQIMRTEVLVEKGITEVEENLVYLKDQLDKARTIKSKLK